jgi:hypothetical protein
MARRPATSGAAGALVVISKWHRRIRWIRRLVMVATVTSSVVKAVQSFRPPSSTRSAIPVRSVVSPARRPVESSAAIETTTVTVSRTTATPASPRWVESDAGVVPDGYPVKVNARSGIYHLPGGRSYDRTRPDRWYRSAADAEADGFRASRSA